MDDKEKKQLTEIGGIFSGSMVNLALAIAVSFVLTPILSWISTTVMGYEKPPEALMWVSMGAFLGIIFVDPVSAWKEKKSLSKFLKKFTIAIVVGVGFQFFISYMIDNMGKDGKFSPVMFVMLPLLMMPVLFGTFAWKRFQENTDAPMNSRIKDAAIEYIDTSGPVIMMATGGVCMLFYWIVDFPVQVLIPLLATLLFAMITWVVFFYDGARPPVEDMERDQDRSKSLGEAASKALDVSISMLPNSMFMIGLIWLAMAFWDTEGLNFAKDPGGIDVLNLIVAILKPALIALGVVIGGVIIASIAGAVSISLVASVNKWGIGEVEQRAKKFNEVLFTGGMGRIFHGNLKERSKEENE